MNILNQARLAAGVIIASAFLTLSGPTQAADKTGEFGVGVGSTDNVFRTPDGDVQDTIFIVAADFSIFSDTGRLQTDTFAQLAYMDYQDGSYDSDLVGGFLSLNSLQLVPNRFAWVINDNFGQRASNPLTPVTPSNRENVNFFRTGPVFDFVRPGRNTARLELLYSRVDYEESASDNARFGGAFTFGRELRRGKDLALVLSTESIEFDDATVATDFDRHAAFLRYQLFGNQTTINMDIGATRVESADEDASGLLLRLSYDRDLSNFMSLRMIAGSNYSDEGNVFRLFQDELREVDLTEDAVNNPDPFVNNYVAGLFTYQNGRNLMRLTLGWNQSDFEGTAGDQDREVFLANFRVQRDFSHSVFGGIRLRYRTRDFKYQDNSTDAITATANLGLRVGPRFRFGLLYQYQTRDDTDATAEYDENRYFLTMTYTPRWSQ
jgi:hypothetical protein